MLTTIRESANTDTFKGGGSALGRHVYSFLGPLNLALLSIYRFLELVNRGRLALSVVLHSSVEVDGRLDLH